MVEERLGVLVQVGNPVENGRYGGGWTWITGQNWGGDIARSCDDWFATEGDVELVGVVEGGMKSVSPGIGGTDAFGGSHWRSAACWVGAGGRNVLSGAAGVIGDVVD